MSYNNYSYPGNGWLYVICDICGKKIRQRDTVKITDRYNLHFGAVVCKYDVDKTNPQAYPIYVRESRVPHPESLRSEQINQFINSASTNRVPSAPQLLQPKLSPIGSTVQLYWQGPIDGGSDGIIGYAVKRANPQNQTLSIILANTNNSVPYYEDLSANVNTNYIYQVAAINSVGMGPYSSPGYYPSQVDDDGKIFITTGNGDYILDGLGNILETSQLI